MQVKLEHSGAWMPFRARHDDSAANRLATWVAANWQDSYDRRIIITPQITNNFINDPDILAELAAGVPWVSPRTDREDRGGPVVAAWPTEETLAYCVQRARNSSLLVFEWGSAPNILGWATAVQAFNAETGESTPPLDAELHDVFKTMLFYDDYLSEGAKRGRHRDITQQRIRRLKDAGLNADFIVTYCIALGFTRDTRRLREHYRAA
ncbi:hypothetical protein MSM1_20375 [Mycobacterium sp. SM1]|uniref:hypothetical protein n=1 Tax=Mycobacterium sp. SM1 TaxID=2816243 RepID=UPI001BCE8F06|nr:hypothetical protein [Mycobacterium sp. SM1]MBS4730574.1 hypothetical protein [Mycobacterium sp. SM1]